MIMIKITTIIKLEMTTRMTTKRTVNCVMRTKTLTQYIFNNSIAKWRLNGPDIQKLPLLAASS